MIIVGLSNNNYLINNDLILLINGFTTDSKYLNVLFENLYNGKTASLRLYPINNTYKTNISPVIKSLFDIPDFDLNKNINEIKITFESLDVDNISDQLIINKYFIRGGVFARTSNNFLTDGETINTLITNKTAIWGTGYTCEDYLLSSGNFTPFEDTNTEDLSNNIECGYGLIFLNQYGTYSVWRFQNYEIKNKTKDLDFVKKFNHEFQNNTFFDLGVTNEKEIKLKTKVHLDYNPLMQHLITSPEIYFFNKTIDKRIKLKQKSNTYTENLKDKMFDYTFSFDLENVNNTALIW